ncbi:MAG: hypothetical protein R3342_09245 [Lutibacter sp.]|uniref:hypothetical protein n=1 Tax=Lutibacter sp. TaxID=1925666 RepID=UPI00299DB52B|nr:hypothetical protein [Lutibacter sp.]MDX1829718.1 hypothetical protein [Lutibacter sp.]
MKRISILLSLFVLLISCNGNSQNTLKRYNVKSGVVKYTTTISGKVIGSKITGSGTESLYFKNWGAIELKDNQSTQISHMKFFGKEKTETTSKHEISKIDNGKIYLVDFKNKTIQLKNNPMMDLMKQSKTNAADESKNMLEAMGGEKIGNETYKGYNCEVWELLGGKQWIYKGVMLKMEMKVLGIKTLTEATSIKFNVSVADSNFKLPDFPIQKIMNNSTDSMISDKDKNELKNSMHKISKLSFGEWKKMAIKNDPEMKNMSDEELHQTYDMIQKMTKMGIGN